MNNSIIVAKATEQVLAPVEFTGKLKDVFLVQKENSPAYISLEIEGLPTLYRKDGNRVSILRTVKQAVNDLRFFSYKGAPAANVARTFDQYAVGREVTLKVSAHEAGAEFAVTPLSNYHVDNGGKYKTGDLVTLEDAGFYVEGFIVIDFSREDKSKRYAELDALEAAADASEF